MLSTTQPVPSSPAARRARWTSSADRPGWQEAAHPHRQASGVRRPRPSRRRRANAGIASPGYGCRSSRASTHAVRSAAHGKARSVYLGARAWRRAGLAACGPGGPWGSWAWLEHRLDTSRPLGYIGGVTDYASFLIDPCNVDVVGDALFVVELEPGVWLSDGDGDPPRTLARANALQLPATAAVQAAVRARRYRRFDALKIVAVTGGGAGGHGGGLLAGGGAARHG